MARDANDENQDGYLNTLLLRRGLLPFALAVEESVFAVAIRAVRFLAFTCPEFLVRRGVDLLFGMAAQAKRIDLRFGEHDVGSGAVPA